MQKMRSDKKHRSLFNLLYTLTYFLSDIPLKLFDILHGTQFSRSGRAKDQGGRYAYFPSPVLFFPLLGGYIRRHMRGGRGSAVLDIGCGKGLMLLFFGRFGFERVSGIEYDKKLCALARENLKAVRHSSAPPVRVYHADATEFSLYGNYDTFYLYNPFDAEILDKCTDRILSTLERRPRTITVIYCNPVHADVLRRKGFKEEARFYYKTRVFVYRGRS